MKTRCEDWSAGWEWWADVAPTLQLPESVSSRIVLPERESYLLPKLSLTLSCEDDKSDALDEIRHIPKETLLEIASSILGPNPVKIFAADDSTMSVRITDAVLHARCRNSQNPSWQSIIQGQNPQEDSWQFTFYFDFQRVDEAGNPIGEPQHLHGGEVDKFSTVYGGKSPDSLLESDGPSDRGAYLRR